MMPLISPITLRRYGFRIDYALRMRRGNGRLLLVALIEAKHEGRAPDSGLEQVKNYAAGRRERIPFVFSTNGLEFIQYDRHTNPQGDPRPLEEFSTPDDLAKLLVTSQDRKRKLTRG